MRLSEYKKLHTDHIKSANVLKDHVAINKIIYILTD